jgi:hypothetical protein
MEERRVERATEEGWEAQQAMMEVVLVEGETRADMAMAKERAFELWV